MNSRSRAIESFDTFLIVVSKTHASQDIPRRVGAMWVIGCWRQRN
jgi:hypothetical protein